MEFIKSLFFIPRKTFLLIVFLAIITFALIYIAVFPGQTPQNQNLQQNVNSNLPQTTLAISSNPAKFSSGSATFYTTDVSINTNSNKVTSIQLELTFDPSTVINVDIKPGSFFNNPTIFIKKIDAENGIISYALGVNSKENGIKGNGTLATITFLPVFGKNKSLKISFNFQPKTQVNTVGNIKSVLANTSDSLFTLSPSLLSSNSAVQKISTQSAK